MTDIYEWGWGQSFHFSPLLPGKNAGQSEAAHEAGLAALLRLQVQLQALPCTAACLCCCCRGDVRWAAPLAAALFLAHANDLRLSNRPSCHCLLSTIRTMLPPASCPLIKPALASWA